MFTLVQYIDYFFIRILYFLFIKFLYDSKFIYKMFIILFTLVSRTFIWIFNSYLVPLQAFSNSSSALLEYFMVLWMYKHIIKNEYHIPFPMFIVAFPCLTHYIHRYIKCIGTAGISLQFHCNEFSVSPL